MTFIHIDNSTAEALTLLSRTKLSETIANSLKVWMGVLDYIN